MFSTLGKFKLCFIHVFIDLFKMLRSSKFIHLSPNQISHKIFTPKTESNPPLYMLHGVLGNKNNFRTLGSKISNNCNCKVVTVDARNHGSSGHVDSMSYQEMSNDLNSLIKYLKHDKINLLGHSMGGRTAMHFALNNANFVNKLIIVDVSPDSNSTSMVRNTILEYIRIISDVDVTNLHLKFTTFSGAKRHVEMKLSRSINDANLVQFIMTNFVFDKNLNNYKWRVNIQALVKCFKQLSNFPVKSGQNFNGDSLFIKGSNSSYISLRNYESIYDLFPKSEIVSIEDCGHWVHSEKPKEFLNLVEYFIK